MIKILAETLVRLCHISTEIHFEDGVAIATDKMIMAAEAVSKFEGTCHINVSPELLKQCETETKFKSWVEIIPQDALQYTIAKTTLGYVSGNIGVWPATDHYIHRWRSIFAQCAEPPTRSTGVMVWNADTIAKLACSSPSGIIVFEEHFQVRDRPALIRDAHSYEWAGCFMGRLNDGIHHPPAVLPTWLKT